jgi:hypothetical protein
MKIIVSHDVDHVAFREHWFRDAFIPKWLAKNLLYAVTGQIPFNLAARRWAALMKPTMHHVAELMETDRRFGIPSTFFVGVSSGLDMSYPLAVAARMVEQIRAGGFPVGVHGIAYEDADAIRAEHDRFQAMPGNSHRVGVRTHYLRFTSATPELQARAGYLFDSSEYGLKAPYVVDGLTEFPVCLMDSYLLTLGRNSLDEIRKRTMAELKKGEQQGLPFFTLIFHDCYFSNLFPDHRDWYLWLAPYLRDHYDLIDFEGAMRELKGDLVNHGSNSSY